ncbi:glycosyltransferase family 1 protein [soil metagenome]
MLGRRGHHGVVPEPLRVAYTLEQCWHDVPGGTAVAALRVAEHLDRDDGIDLVGVAGRHRRPPEPPWRPTIGIRALPVARPWLYEAWLRARWPLVESVTGPVDVCHATGLVPAASEAPLAVTVHDLAFVRYPERFSRHGVRTMRRSLEVIARRADAVLCSSLATVADVTAAGIGADRVRHVPLGVDPVEVTHTDIARVRDAYSLPERFVLFVGTVEPRKNLVRLATAVNRFDEPLPLVVVGADGWGDALDDVQRLATDVHFLGFVPSRDLPACYSSATVFAYPSEWEGFGLPVAEAMAQGVPVVTSRGTSTEEVAGGAAVLVDPCDTDDIARGITDALEPRDRAERVAAGRHRAAELTWATTAAVTADVYREIAR